VQHTREYRDMLEIDTLSTTRECVSVFTRCTRVPDGGAVDPDNTSRVGKHHGKDYRDESYNTYNYYALHLLSTPPM
jgi:hypothetical protein